MFDVDVIVERDILDKIINAYAVTKLEASISYSNPGHTNGFQAAFDTKLREMGGSRTEFKVSGSREHPLGNEEDGMLHAIVNLSEHNGNVRATIQASENSNLEVINSSEHPKILVIPQIVNDICSTIYDAVRNIFNN